MLFKRVIPCLLLHKGGLYKTKKFKNPNYIGDPINAIRIFNEKEVDEIMLMDIDASINNAEPNYNMIEDVAGECFMPLCYGGGIKTIEQIKKIYNLGVEKISISTQAIQNLDLVNKASEIFGNQSIIVTLDIKKDIFGKKKIFTHNGTKNTKLDPLEFVLKVEQAGAGEIVINSIDLDGMMCGYDLDILKQIKSSVKVPLIALGGAGNIQHIRDAFNIAQVNAVALGSMCVYHGALNGVLINYPFINNL